MKKYIIAFLALLSLPITGRAGDMKTNYEIATFAGGCFWCMQPVFDELEGVTETNVGYSGGDKDDANYEAVSNKETAHYEAIQIKFTPQKITYETLLEKFIRNIDPLDPLGQFADKGPQYKTAVFYHNNIQKQVAEKFFAEIESMKILDGEIQTEILPYKNYFPAEEYHQKYYKKNSVHYNAYKYGSGRVDRLKEIWGE
ncbi:MAG TPA: peptide-methionine (S)-S-oxide reductase [Alphaproteobacteria bacterium]|nr:peptide-methionine (S)-S-oxide reductase [Alphaproteobacteria bacterium]